MTYELEPEVYLDLRAHPEAEKFPMLTEEAFDELKDSIAREGLLEPVVTIEEDGQLMILDGRHRLTAAHSVGVQPRFERYEDVSVGANGERISPARWVIVKNMRRRHSSQAARAIVAGRFREHFTGRPSIDGQVGSRRMDWADHAEKEFVVDAETIRRADRLIRAVDGEEISGRTLDAEEREALQNRIEAVLANNEKIGMSRLVRDYLERPERREPTAGDRFDGRLEKASAELRKALRLMPYRRLSRARKTRIDQLAAILAAHKSGVDFTELERGE